MIKKLAFVCIWILTASLSGFAQYNMNTPVPMDPKVRTGKLENGLTYYIRHNAEPKERASFYIIQDVGAILENDNQNGLAHFLEHMAFNGTKHFPGRKGIVSVLEKYGIEFGRNINAYTAQDETVYNIDDVPTGNPKLLDTCLLILHDWSHYLELTDAEIDIERPVISEEWRTRRNPSFRMNAAVMPVLLNNSKYAHRDVIGDLDLIKTFPYQVLRDFYHEWYRPDLQAIAVVGDFDVNEMEKKVIDLFSRIPAAKNPTPRPRPELPPHEGIKYVQATDKELTASTVEVYIKFPATPKEKKDHQYMRDGLLRSFYNQMLGGRISELLEKGNPPFVRGNCGIYQFMAGSGAYYMNVTAMPNQEALALEAIYRENERVKRHGFTSGELERRKTNMLVNLESAYKQQDKVPTSSYVKEIQEHFLQNEPMPDFDYYYAFVKAVLPTITVEEISALAPKYIHHTNMVIVVKGPSEGVTHISEEEALAVIDKVEKSNIEPYVDEAAGTALISGELPGSPVVKTKKLPAFDALEWTLANGAKVVFRKADFDKESVELSGYSPGGTSLYEVDKLASAQMTAQFIDAYGLGDFDATALRKVLTGKRASSKVGISGLFETVSGGSTPADFETMMQLIYLRFEKPRFDKEAHNAMMQRNYANIALMSNNPQKILQDSLSMIMSNYSPRTLLFGKDFLDKISLQEIEEIYRDRIRDISDFTFIIVGNIDAETARPIVEKYIGSIASHGRKENWIDRKVRGPKGKTEKVIPVKLETPKTTVVVNFNREMKFTPAHSIYNTVLKSILDMRYMENIREKEGGTYGVQVQSGSSRIPYSGYSMTMVFDCDPDKAERLKSLVYVDVEQLMKAGPTQEELDKVLTTLRKNREQSKPHNSYWMNILSAYYQSGINSDDPKNFEKIVDKVTPKAIQKHAQQLFGGADVIDLMFVPAK